MNRALLHFIVGSAVIAGCASGSEDGSVDGGDGLGAGETSTPTTTPDGGGTTEDASLVQAPPGEAGASLDARPPPASDDSGGSGDPFDADVADDGADDAPSPDGAAALDGGADGSDGGGGDLAPTGSAYTWQSMTSSTADTGKLAAPAVNDGSLATQVDIDSNTGDDTNAWEAAGVVFVNAVTVSSVVFVQGTTGSASSGDGWFEANFGLEVSSNGTTWAPANGWTVSPAYAYSSAVSGKTFTFTGTALSGVKGVRVVGQVNTVGKSWWAAVKEVMVYGE